jgi:hypothetical protein
MKLDLLTNATVVDDAIRLTDEENQDRIKNELESASTTTNQVF